MKRVAVCIVLMLAAASNCFSADAVPPVPMPPLQGTDSDVRDAVLAAYRLALKEPANAQASGRLGMVLHANALYDSARLSYERAIRLEPNEFAWRYYLALVWQQLHQPEKALDEIGASLRIRPNYTPAALTQGDILFQLGRFQESGTAYESLLARDPASAEALYGLARSKYARGDVAGAADFYRRACQAYSKFGAAYYGLGEAARSLRDEAESAKNFDLAKLYKGDRPPAADPLASQVEELATGVFHYLAQADQLRKNGRMDEAARLNEKVLARDPENLNVLLQLLSLAWYVNRLDDQVETFFERAKRIDPQNPVIFTSYGAVMVRQGKLDMASAALRHAIELKPDSAEPHRWLGEVLERQDRPVDAIGQYQRALAADPADPTVQMKLWWLLITHGGARETIPQLLPAIQTEDSLKSTRLFLLGEAYRAVADFGKSRQYLEEARSRVAKEGPPDLLTQIEQELKQLP